MVCQPEITGTFLWRSNCGQEEARCQEEGCQEDDEEERRQEGREEEDQKGEEVSDKAFEPCTECLGVKETQVFSAA
jgi:hypothetical protein